MGGVGIVQVRDFDYQRLVEDVPVKVLGGLAACSVAILLALAGCASHGAAGDDDGPNLLVRGVAALIVAVLVVGAVYLFRRFSGRTRR